MQGIIGLEQLEVTLVIGVHPHERLAPQTVLVDIKVMQDLSLCMKSDHLADALDYEVLAKICFEVASHAYHLIEAYAYAVWEKIREKTGSSQVWVRISKPKAFPEVKTAYVEMGGV